MNEDVAIKVEHVSKVFKLPHEKTTTLKSAVVNFYKRKRSFEKQQALKDISFDVKKGEFFGIVGRNGSGKSTLLKLLSGIYSPTQGSIQVNGKLTPFIELGVGFNQELSGRENIFLNGALLGFSRKEMSTMYDDIVEFAELKRFMDQKLKNYSSGMQVRLAFSIAIRAKSDILLLDEVLAVGDAAFQQKCYNYFEELKQQNKTVIFVSHDMNAVRRFCNRAVYIDNGDLTHQGAPSEIADVYLEENMESTRQSAKKPGVPELSKKHVLSVKLHEGAESTIVVQLTYASEQKEEMYLGISVLKDGISIAEMNTIDAKPLIHAGRATYYLNASQFNGGMYYIGAGLFKLSNNELLSFTKNKAQFIVKGSDPTRGAALKLEDTWEYN